MDRLPAVDQTIISVDGARPNVDAAKKEGLSYVHIPIGYNGVPRKRVLLVNCYPG
jgi:hypothetical protein